MDYRPVIHYFPFINVVSRFEYGKKFQVGRNVCNAERGYCTYANIADIKISKKILTNVETLNKI